MEKQRDFAREYNLAAVQKVVELGLSYSQGVLAHEMMNPESDTFFSYAFVVELEPMPELTEAVAKAKFLKYYRT
ncbi:MAG: hypothetical protein ABI557_01970 [Aureliella sp.]